MAALGGGGGNYGMPFRMIDKSMQDATETFKKVGPHNGLPKIGDIPLLITSLSVADASVVHEAHSALVWLSGIDLGADPKPWLAWWKQEGPRQAHREREVQSARDLFGGFKSDVLTGRWESAANCLSRRLRGKQTAPDCTGFMKASARLLRKVYRDAKIASLEVSGEGGRITVDWGELGFEFKGIRLVREDDSWKLDTFPWGSKVTVQERDVAPHADAAPQSSDPGGVDACPLISRRRNRGSRGTGTIISVLAALGLVFGTLYLINNSSSNTGNMIFLTLAMVMIISVPASLLFCILFGRIRRSRDIIGEIRRHRGSVAPNARARRQSGREV